MSKYTQRDWERTVGWGKGPPEYNIEERLNGWIRKIKSYNANNLPLTVVKAE